MLIIMFGWYNLTASQEERQSVHGKFGLQTNKIDTKSTYTYLIKTFDSQPSTTVSP